jgi:hypothetical protein
MCLDLRRNRDPAFPEIRIIRCTIAQLTGKSLIKDVLDNMIVHKSQFCHHLLAGNFRCGTCEHYHIFKRRGEAFHREFKVTFHLVTFILNFFIGECSRLIMGKRSGGIT